MVRINLSQQEIKELRREEFPNLLRDAVLKGHTRIIVSLDQETALSLADDVEFAVNNKGSNDT